MADTIYGVTRNGFVRKPLATIITDLNSKFQAAFGTSFDVTPESPDGQVIGIISDKISELWDLGQAAYNSYRPGATMGVGLDAIVELNRITRRVNVPTTATCVLDGDAGLVVPAGSIVSTEDGTYEFTTNDDATLPTSVTVTCTVTGEVVVLANTITKIVSTLDGWDTVNNPNAGTTGVDYESDPELRARRENSTIVTGTNTAEAIYDALASMSLSYIRVRDNDSEDSVGDQPAKSFQVVVVGGTDNDIAQTIFDNKPAGIQAYGTTIIKVADSKGYLHDVGFSRPTNVNIYIVFSFTRYSGSSNDTANTIANALVAYVNALQPGESVVWSKLVSVAQLATQNVEIDSLFMGTAENPTTTTTITMDINQRAYSDSTLVTGTDVTS